jgi:hypothetical protein
MKAIPLLFLAHSNGFRVLWELMGGQHLLFRHAFRRSTQRFVDSTS